MEVKMGISYVCINDSLRYFLSPIEMSFILRVKQLEFIRSTGKRTAYSSEFYFKSFNISRTPFYKTARRLEELGILIREPKVKYTDYKLHKANYERLLKISSATYHVDALREFAQREFVENKRSVDKITDEEIAELAKWSV